MHLSDYMAANGLDDETVASKIRRSRATVSRIRRKKARPDWDTLEEIKKFTGGACVADDFQHIEQGTAAA